MLLQIKNVAAASNAALQHDVVSLKRETEEMQSKLESSLESFDTVQQEAQAVEGEVVDEVCLLTLCLFSHMCTWQHFTSVSVVCGNKASCVYALCDPLICANSKEQTWLNATGPLLLCNTDRSRCSLVLVCVSQQSSCL